MDEINPQVESVTVRSVWELIRATAGSWMNINAPRLGAALAFYTMLSIAPLLVICMGIAGLMFGREAVQGQLVWQIRDLVGTEGGKAIEAVLANASSPSSSVVAAVVGIFLLFLSASAVVGELRDALNLIWSVKSSGPSGLIGIIQYRFVSFAMVIGVGFLLMVSLILSALIAAAGKILGSYLPVPEAVLHLVNLAVSFLAFTFIFAVMYRMVPDVHIEWRDVWIGAGVTSVLFSLGKFFIGLYLGKAAVGSPYGAAGSLVVFLVWVYYSAQVFFLGAEFTRNFAERHGSRAARRQRETAHTAIFRRFRRPRLA